MEEKICYIKNNEPIRLSNDTYNPNGSDKIYISIIDYISRFGHTSYVEKDMKMKLE
jgi:hypothetical protein